MNFEQPASTSKKRELNPMQQRMAEAKASHELRNAFEAIGTAGELTAKFENALEIIEVLKRSPDLFTRKWSQAKFDELSLLIDNIARLSPSAFTAMDDFVRKAKHIIDEVNVADTPMEENTSASQAIANRNALRKEYARSRSESN